MLRGRDLDETEGGEGLSDTATSNVILSTRSAGGRPPRVSVAVSTYQRAQQLPRLFQALSEQTLPKEDFEVVIVDNGSDAATAEAIRSLGPVSGLRLHTVRLETNHGPSAGRNAAWRNATADVVAFTDDDCAPAPNWLEAGLKAMQSGDSVVVGRTLPDPAFPIGPFSRTVYVVDATWLPTCNVFYRRQDLEVVSGFDEGFTIPGGEDTDLGYRVRAACERKFRFSTDALVYHDVRPSKFLDAAKETMRWTDAPRFFRLHPEGRIGLHRGIFWRPSHPKVLLAMAGILLGLRSPQWLVLVLPWVHHRTRIRRPHGTRVKGYVALPGVFVIDSLETIAMIRGSVRNRSIVL